jgi:hypothetical protein
MWKNKVESPLLTKQVVRLLLLSQRCHLRIQMENEDAGMNCSKSNCSFNDWVRFETSLDSTQGEENPAKLIRLLFFAQLTLLL